MPAQPVKWVKDQKENFRSWFFNQLHDTMGDRQQLERQWEDNIINWRARLIGDGVGDVPFIGAPYSKDTEILTRLGWKAIEEVELGELVLTRDDDTGRTEWAPVQAKPSFWFEELLHFKSRTVDLMVFPSHDPALDPKVLPHPPLHTPP